jgi:hypothetical protein
MTCVDFSNLGVNLTPSELRSSRLLIWEVREPLGWSSGEAERMTLKRNVD